MKRKVVSFLLCVAMLFVSVSLEVSVKAQTDAPEGFSLAAQSERLSLYYNTQNGSIAVEDRDSGAMWYSYLPDSEFPEGDMTDEIKNEMQSLLILEYSQANIASNRTTVSSLNSLQPQITAEPIADGVAFAIYLSQLNLQFTVEFSLSGDRLTVRIPNEEIQEGIGTQEQLQTQKENLTGFAEQIRAIAGDIRADAELPSKYKENVGDLIEEIDNFENTLNQINSAVRIDSAADQLAAFIQRMRSVALSGETGSLGIINEIRMSAELSDSVKQRYNAVFNTLTDTLELAEMSTATLKSISVTSLVEVRVLPYFGSSGDKSEGYMLYPDGSGAIAYFKENHPSYSGAYRSDIYAEDTPNLDYTSLLEERGVTGTMLPVIGVRKNGSAFVAVATSGDEECFAVFQPSGYILNVNRTFLGFRYRRRVTGGSSMGSFTGSEGNYQYETDRRDISPELVYTFLDGDQADYSGMANAVRKLYLENGTLQKSSMLAHGRMPLALNIFCGYNNKQLIFDNYQQSTSYYQAAEILNDIARNSDMKLMMNLTSWCSEESLGAEPLGAYGGSEGLQQLADMAELCSAALFLEYNPYLVSTGISGFKEGDLAVATSLLIFQGTNTNNMVLSPTVMAEKYSRILDGLQPYGVDGVTLDGAGSFLYYDYNPKRLTTRQGTVAKWQEAMQDTKETLKAVSTVGGNGYTLGLADWLQEIPSTSTGYSYSDEDVPFYQMVVHGSIPYSGKHINAYYDPQTEKLRAIEYGYVPSYSVTYDTVENATTFTSVYEDVRQELLDVCEEYHRNLSCIADQAMVDHEVLGSQVKVTYENGVVIYLNYGSEDAVVDGHTVKALDYIVVGGEQGEEYEKEISEYEAPGESGGISVYVAVAGGIFAVLLISAGVFLAARLWKRHRQAHL